MTLGKDDELDSAIRGAGAAQLQVFRDQFSDDIEAIQTKARVWENVKDAMIEFGGARDSIRKIYCDMGPEFKKACIKAIESLRQDGSEQGQLLRIHAVQVEVRDWDSGIRQASEGDSRRS